ncbi:hypothetical protein ACGFYQ_27500 [Streptomyces sp. NPDC048258]|uniref:hypothetical protein n=1 Tax=Streptomyces sp. NPDC048258 TaxID=3365527 RepID=UPI00371362C7
MTTDQNGSHDLPAIKQALGEMVYQAASLEMVIRFAGELTAKDSKAAKALSGMTAGQLLPAVAKLVRVRTDKVTSGEVDQFEQIVNDAGPELESRNTYIHGAWGEENGALLAMNWKKGGAIRTRSLDVAALEKLSAELLALVNRTMEWGCNVIERNPDLVRSQP